MISPFVHAAEYTSLTMLDLKYILQNVDAVRTNCKNRNVAADVERVVGLAERRSRLMQDAEELRKRRNENAQATGREKDAARRQQLVDEGRQLKDRIAAREAELAEAETEIRSEQLKIPNMTHPDAPVGAGDDANRVVRHWGEPRKFDFKPVDHLELGERLELIDMERGGKVAGTSFYFLKNEAVLLELALIQYAMNLVRQLGFTPVITPDLARDDVLQGIGFSPRGEATQIYSVEGTDLSLIATAEITVGGMHKDEIFEEEQLPLKYVGLSHCFRTEAGAAGRATRGLYRVHQFTKVEMFAFTLPEQSDATLEQIRDIEERIFQGLGIPYRVIDTCTGDLGGPAYRKYDLEAWMPARGDSGEYGEVTSTSNCTDYQARRLGIRFKRKGKKGTEFLHTLNGTAVAISRALIVIIENHQQSDGSIVVPEVLRPWMGMDRIGPRA
jgi:seryl-tRNA synthetase